MFPNYRGSAPLKKENPVLRKLFLGFIHTHILYHANKEPFYGQWMMHELKEHGYEISPGTLYPILHNMTAQGLLYFSLSIVDGKQRKYYHITELGKEVLQQATAKSLELARELTKDEKNL